MDDAVDAEYYKELDKAQTLLENQIIYGGGDRSSRMLRLAFCDAGGKLGPNGSIRHLENLDVELKKAIEICGYVKEQHPTISFADLYQLAGLIELRTWGGPYIPFSPGREDSEFPPEPLSPFQRFKPYFRQLGLSDENFVALSRSMVMERYPSPKKVVRDHKSAPQLHYFDNSYFRHLLEEGSRLTNPTSMDVFVELPLKHSMDKELFEDEDLRPYVEKFASDARVFEEAYIEAHRKFSLLGFIPRVPHYEDSIGVAPVVDDHYLREIKDAREDLRKYILEQDCGPLMLRLGWSDAATYCKHSKTGGPNGSIRNQEEYSRAENRGLKKALDLCERVKRKHPRLTYADLYQLGAIEAVESANGPIIPFVPGRTDSAVSTEEGRLPEPRQGCEFLRRVFHRMGLNDRDIVALSGAHTIGRAHKDRSGYEGPWTKQPHEFDNSYFQELFYGKSAEGLVILPSDRTLMEDTIFFHYVGRFAKDAESFSNAYKAAHKKFSELGFIHIEDPYLNPEVLYDGDIVKNTMTEIYGVVSSGGDKFLSVVQPEVRPLFKEDSSLVARVFNVGQAVTRTGDRTGLGFVLAVGNKTVGISSSKTGKTFYTDVEDLVKIRSFFSGDVVIKGTWIGEVKKTEVWVDILYDDGTDDSLLLPTQQGPKPIYSNALERHLAVAYFKGQAVLKAIQGGRLRGTVDKHEVWWVHVGWFTKGRKDDPPLERISDTELELLEPFEFRRGRWSLGQRCRAPAYGEEEFLVTECHPISVSVMWEGRDDKEEIDSRDLVAAEVMDLVGNGFFRIGQAVRLVKEKKGWSQFGVVTGLQGNDVIVDWCGGRGSTKVVSRDIVVAMKEVTSVVPSRVANDDSEC